MVWRNVPSTQSDECLSLAADCGGLLGGCLDFVEGEDLADFGVKDALAVERGDFTEQQKE